MAAPFYDETIGWDNGNDKEEFQMGEPVFLPLTTYREFSDEEMKSRIQTFRDELRRRRTVRQFSSRPVAREEIDDGLRIAGHAPSGAILQPWHYVGVRNPQIARMI